MPPLVWLEEEGEKLNNERNNWYNRMVTATQTDVLFLVGLLLYVFLLYLLFRSGKKLTFFERILKNKHQHALEFETTEDKMDLFFHVLDGLSLTEKLGTVEKLFGRNVKVVLGVGNNKVWLDQIVASDDETSFMYEQFKDKSHIG